MKKTIAVMMFIGMVSSIFAQEGDKRKERREMIEKKRVEFVNERAQLTPEEAAKFWPLNEKLTAEKKALKKDKPRKKDINFENLSESEAADMLRERSKIKAAELRLEDDYLEKMISAIGAKKLMAVHRAEKAFKREVLKNLKEGRGQG